MRNTRSTLVLVLALAGIACAAPLLADNSLLVTPAAAMTGSYGLEVFFDGSSNVAYVQENDFTSSEAIYRASFLFNRNSLVLPPKAAHSILRLSKATADKKVFRLNIKSSSDGLTYVVYAYCRNDSAVWQLFGATVVKAKPTTLMIEFQAASAPGANDGICRLYKGTTLKGELTNVDNDTKVVDTVRLGLTGAGEAGTTGSSYYDDFQSFRTLAAP